MSKANKQTPMRISDNFSEEIFELKGDAEKKFKRDISVREITEAIPQHPRWKSFKQDFMDSVVDFKNNRRGSGWDYIILGVTAVFMMVFFIFFSYGFHLGYSNLLNITNPSIPLMNGSTGILNVTGAFEQTYGKLDTSYQSFRWLGIVLIFASFISILISNAFVKDYPIAFLGYALFILLSVFISTYISDAYVTAVSSPFISQYASDWVGYLWIMQNLPVIITIVGFIGGIILVANVIMPQPQQ